jgi:hypothetical protein
MTTQSGNRCEKGHNMDPSWDQCPYCAAEKKSGVRADLQAVANESPSSARKTYVDDSPNTAPDPKAADQERVTRIMPDPNSIGRQEFRSSGAGGVGDTRRIVAVLISYSWLPSGQIYPVRLGKNYIGAGKEADFYVQSDPKMSSNHALILCREGRSTNEVHFDLIDQQSSNGTYLNGELAPLIGVSLPNYAKIETGKTEWLFIKVSP